MGCGPQSRRVPVRIPISFQSQAVQNAGGCSISVGSALFTLSKWTHGAAPFCTNSRNLSALLHNKQIPGEANLNLMKARSKLSGSRYLTVLPKPSLIRVKQHVNKTIRKLLEKMQKVSTGANKLTDKAKFLVLVNSKSNGTIWTNTAL